MTASQSKAAFLKMARLSREMTIPLVIAATTLCDNVLSSLLFSRLPDDPHHLAIIAMWYLLGAAAMCIFGAIGAWRQYAISTSIFSTYLFLDALFTTIPRIMISIYALNSAPELCVPPNTTQSIPKRVSPTTHTSSQSHPAPEIHLPARSASSNSHLQSWARWRSRDIPSEDCAHIPLLTESTICIVVLTAAILQLYGATLMRGYAKRLHGKRRRDALLADGADDQQISELEAIFSGRDDGWDSTNDPEDGGIRL